MTRFHDGCAVSHALDLIGDPGALVIIRELLFGGRTRAELALELTTVDDLQLEERLQQLQRADAVQRVRPSDPDGETMYELTPRGWKLKPVIEELARWGVASPAHNPNQPLTSGSIALALSMYFEAAQSTDLAGDVVVNFEDGRRLFVRIAAGTVQIGYQPLSQSNATISAPPGLLLGVLVHALSIEDVMKGGLVIDGDAVLANAFLGRLFAFPPPAVG